MNISEDKKWQNKSEKHDNIMNNSTAFDDIANNTRWFDNSTTEFYDAFDFTTENFTVLPCWELNEHALYVFWTNGILLNIVGVLGILGNIISMIILSRPQMRSSINYLLIGLARCDTVLILTSILLFGLPGIYPS